MPLENKPSSQDRTRDTPARELAAILFADIVGYTALMQQGEANALNILNRFEVITRDKVHRHSGEIIKNYGDGSLILFSSTVHAVQCAEEMQLAFSQEPKVPLRIGIHVGEIVRKGKDIFGNGVNIASRVESMGVAGAVLLSKTAYDRVSNQEHLELKSLGTFEFKNVSEGMEVFGLVSDGIIIPKREEMRGKVKTEDRAFNKSYIWKYIIPALILIGALGYLGYSQIISSKQNLSTQIETINEKRITVTVFENQTKNTSLEDFGLLSSDWITNALKESGDLNVINAANIQHHFGEEPINNISKLQLKDITGVDYMVQGRYYQNEQQLFINADIVDLSNGNTIKNFLHQGTVDQMMKLLNELTQDVLSYWTVKEQNRFAQNPPKYKAYQQWMLAQNVLDADPEQAELHLQNAFALDTSFYAPIFGLYKLYTRLGKDSLSSDLLQFVERRKNRFTKWEKLSVEELKAIEEKDWSLAAQLAEKKYDMDRSDVSANNASVSFYNSIHQPQKALELLTDFDPRFLNEDEMILGWRTALEAYSLFVLGRYEEVTQLIKKYPHPKIADALAVIHLKSIVHLNNAIELDDQFRYYKERGVYSNTGKLTPIDQIIALICDELVVTNNAIGLDKYSGILLEWTVDNKSHTDYYKNLGLYHFYQGEFQLALDSWKQEKELTQDLPGWLRLPLEAEQKSRLGYCYGALGDSVNSDLQLEAIYSLGGDAKKMEDVQHYYAARILAAEGEKDKAVKSLYKALDNGFYFFRPSVFQTDPFLKLLFDYSDFEELVRPKG